MPEVSQKIQLRADLITILNKYRQQGTIDAAELKRDLETIKNFQDKKLAAKVLFKELMSAKGEFANICAIFALEGISAELFEQNAIDFLKNPDVLDEKKFFMVSLLKQKGIDFNYDNISYYIENPEQIAQKGVKDFLLNALNDPEVQIDLLDFYLNIPHDEKIYLLENIIAEAQKDDLANALSLLAQLDIQKEELGIIIQGLIDSKSPYAGTGLNYILNHHKINETQKRAISLSLKELEFQSRNFKNDALIKNSTIEDCFIGFCDGYANFSVVYSRKRKDDLFDAALLTINLNKGITSCMGFGSIAFDNKASIIKRLFCDSMPVKISPMALKALCRYYYEKNFKTNTIAPYEYIVWKNLLNDVKDINYDLAEFINSKLETINLTLPKAKKFICSKMLETWYYSYKQNEIIDNLIAQLEEGHIFELEKINELVSKCIDENFIENKDFLLELQSKLLIQAYVAHLAGLKMSSAASYSFCFKNPYVKLLITSIVDKSLYYYFSTRALEKTENDKSRFKQKFKTNFTLEELELIMSQLEEKWN